MNQMSAFDTLLDEIAEVVSDIDDLLKAGQLSYVQTTRFCQLIESGRTISKIEESIASIDAEGSGYEA